MVTTGRRHDTPPDKSEKDISEAMKAFRSGPIRWGRSLPDWGQLKNHSKLVERLSMLPLKVRLAFMSAMLRG